MTCDKDTKPKGRQLPGWLRKKLPVSPHSAQVRQLLRELGLNTVCASAHCPNLCECFAKRTATFMILGTQCTRACGFCAVGSRSAPTPGPKPPREDEPEALAKAAKEMNLAHVVITCVTRDDLEDGGAGHFARTIRAVRQAIPQTVIEVLTSDFAGKSSSIGLVLEAHPDIFNHNLETVERLTPTVRPQASYARSLGVLAHAHRSSLAPQTPSPELPLCQDSARRLYTKSGLMVGLGETDDEIRQAMRDLRGVGCEILTLGQYLSPSPAHLPVARFVQPAAFDRIRAEALAMGFSAVAAGPFVRSSYNAQSIFEQRQQPFAAEHAKDAET